MKTVALVESPVQLLNVVEWANQPDVDASSLRVVVLAPRNEVTRLQLKAVAALARTASLTVVWSEPRLGGAETARTVRSLSTELSGVERLIIGDPFSGVLQVVMSITRAAEVVIVDDGTATMEFARQWLAGEHLTRWHTVATERHRRQITSFARDQIAASVRRRLSPETGCRLSIFTCMPIVLPRVAVTSNTFSWVRSRFPTPAIKPSADLIGTSLVETGVVERKSYLRGVQSLAEVHSIDRYFAHRKETPDKLAEIETLGLTVVRPELPLEIVVRTGVVGQTLISFPSTVIYTLPLVLSDTSTKLLVCSIADDWFTQQAPARSDRFLGDVTDGARHRFGLSAIAC